MPKASTTYPHRAKLVTLTPKAMRNDELVSVVRLGSPVAVSSKAVAAMKRSRTIVEDCLADGQAHYGINTGFGSLAKQRVGPDDLKALQRNLVRSHSAGVGEPLRPELVRAMMLILAGSLARGLSGVRPVVVQTLVRMLNAGVTPVVPSIGSVGASGDLAPLAHVALCMIGEGHAAIINPKTLAVAGPGASAAMQFSKHLPAAKALAKAGIKPLELHAKEGLALINGTHLMCAEAALLAHDYDTLIDAAIIALAMSIDACRASHSFLDERLYLARNQLMGGNSVAEALRRFLKGSQIRESHRTGDARVQDPYSLRAGPTVLGVMADYTLNFEYQISHELGAVTDNPLVFAKGVFLPEDWRGTTLEKHAATSRDTAIVSGANFHGMPLALPLDCLAIALCHVAGISERRTFLMTGGGEPEMRLKPFLTPKPGLRSGMMIAQYTAAACVNEMIGLANPASISNIPTCGGMEDYNSWGPRSAAKARRSLELATKVVAIEMLCAAQALDAHKPLKSGEGVEKARAVIRSRVKRLDEDRALTDDIEAIAALIADHAFTALH